MIGELNCLTKQEMEYEIICETAVQVGEFYFIKWFYIVLELKFLTNKKLYVIV